MRADALKNRQKLIEVAVELILQAGGAPLRDAVAAKAGVGIGTLYRHFPDQQALLHATARHVLERTIATGERLLERSSEPGSCLREYMHAALDHGIGVVNIIYPLLERRDWDDLGARSGVMLKSLVERALRSGQVRADLAERDIVFALIRFSRPLAVGLAPEEERASAHRHLDIYIDGLERAACSR